MNLATKWEKTLFSICLILSMVFWVVIIFMTKGIASIFAIPGYLLALFLQSTLITHLKGNAVQITAGQFPELHLKVQAACEKLKMDAPIVYLLNGDGAMNALATHFLRHHYLVLYSDVIDAFEQNSAPIDFYIGHELGHIQRKHTLWWPVFLPLKVLPLLIPAYQRACEFSCDQYGKFCSASTEDGVRGLALLAAGRTKWKTLSIANYVAQVKESGGFWMSLHELTGSYPWLSKRIAVLQGGEEAVKIFPRRHPLACFLALFCPALISSAFMPLLALCFLVILLAIAVPNFEKQRLRAKEAAQKYETPASE